MNIQYILIGLGLFSFIFFITSAILIVRVSKLKKVIKTLSLSYKRLSEIIASRPNSVTDDEVHKENFIKFLSDSRDWAFEYIEEVQHGLNKFVDDIEPEINYFKEYGDIGSMQPNYYSLKKITSAYEELKNLLPKEEEEVK
jgi:hypothetical protein